MSAIVNHGNYATNPEEADTSSFTSLVNDWLTTNCMEAAHMKRKRKSLHIENRIIAEGSNSHTAYELSSLTRTVSPPPIVSRKFALAQPKSKEHKFTTAQIEAGEKDVENHLEFFSSKLLGYAYPSIPNLPRLNHEAWVNLYTHHSGNANGHHFVIHQHDHPIAGTHYDLRLQCNATSSVSWAVMYGLPGDPNSRRLNRNATETRIHCLWNHLIETASHQTGTLLIWDTGSYEILPYHSISTNSKDTTSDEDSSDVVTLAQNQGNRWNLMSEPEKLHHSFNNRRIRIRLHGTRLPLDYTIYLWLRSSNNQTSQPNAPRYRRMKGSQTTPKKLNIGRDDITDSDGEHDLNSDSGTASQPARLRKNISSINRNESPPANKEPYSRAQNSTKTETRELRLDPQNSHFGNESDEQELIRANNAYVGATNSINSIHQRKWYLALDRTNSGFIKDQRTGRWNARSDVEPTRESESIPTPHAPKRRNLPPNQNSDSTVSVTGSDAHRKRAPLGFAPFYVRGREYEHSVVTGRLASDILADEGVVGYVPRGKWRPVLE